MYNLPKFQHRNRSNFLNFIVSTIGTKSSNIESCVCWTKPVDSNDNGSFKFKNNDNNHYLKIWIFFQKFIYLFIYIGIEIN